MKTNTCLAVSPFPLEDWQDTRSPISAAAPEPQRVTGYKKCSVFSRDKDFVFFSQVMVNIFCMQTLVQWQGVFQALVLYPLAATMVRKQGTEETSTRVFCVESPESEA